MRLSKSWVVPSRLSQKAMFKLRAISAEGAKGVERCLNEMVELDAAKISESVDLCCNCMFYVDQSRKYQSLHEHST